jgi:hypothetical protein
MANSTEEIKSLDSNDDGFVFIKHKMNSTIWKLKNTSAKHSLLLKESIIDNPNTETYGTSESNPMSLTGINLDTIPFVVAYMKHYDGIVERDPPEQPLKNIHLSVLFDTEYHLFNNIYDEDNSVDEKLLILNDYIETSLYFDIKHLPNKLCAIAASILKDLPIAEIKQLINN